MTKSKPNPETFPRLSGAAPYGYRPVEGKKLLMERDPIEYAVVFKIMQDWDGGKGYTYQDIATRLNTAGHTTRRGKQWKQYTVYNVTQRELKLAKGTGADDD